MQNDNLSNNGVNETGANSVGLSPGRSPPAQQRGSGRHHATAGISGFSTDCHFSVRRVLRLSV